MAGRLLDKEAEIRTVLHLHQKTRLVMLREESLFKRELGRF